MQNSPNSEQVGQTASVQLTDPALMTSEARLILIQRYRERVQSGELVTVEELQHAIACIGADRAAASRERAAGKKTAQMAVTAPSLEDL